LGKPPKFIIEDFINLLWNPQNLILPNKRSCETIHSNGHEVVLRLAENRDGSDADTCCLYPFRQPPDEFKSTERNPIATNIQPAAMAYEISRPSQPRLGRTDDARQSIQEAPKHNPEYPDGNNKKTKAVGTHTAG
jgi:hypothetical protein